MERLPVGTKEYLIVDLADRLAGISTLDGLGLKYHVLDENDTHKYTNQNGNNVGMRAYCYIDTTLGGAWAAGEYRLYVLFALAPEAPIVGPIYFMVDAL